MAAVASATFASALSAVTWTCSASLGAVCPASGSGGIDAKVDLPVGGVVTFTADGTVDSGAAGNVATVAVPDGTIEVNPGDNSAADTDALTPQADLEITLTGPTAADPGAAVAYEITVFNHGLNDVDGARVRDDFPDELGAVSWGCASTDRALCTGAGTVTARPASPRSIPATTASPRGLPKATPSGRGWPRQLTRSVHRRPVQL